MPRRTPHPPGNSHTPKLSAHQGIVEFGGPLANERDTSFDPSRGSGVFAVHEGRVQGAQFPDGGLQGVRHAAH
ncbi:hypothetical protein GCM10009754_44170 [Amycolatopsis minnesotensis]|uniref:Uncharacterized protein n=1 Tax=Amycolatopsis minnesotensis TaxID=337894 RepID=A0ABN2RCG5_9PSEU